ncbi:MAG TPA: hypothetical protein VE399_05060 [Gemmatimonadales bacterium]|nr:hypothetical protein [Gemmatimonadales bacterium]
MRTLYGGRLMRMVTRILPIAALALGLGAAQLPAQQPGNTTFQWYVGGHGGIMDFGTPVQGRSQAPVGGAHLLVTARRTGLLLSVEQAFGSNEPTGYNQVVFDTAGNVVGSNAPALTFDYLRKYSATLVAFPIKGPLTPYFGIGVGVMHAGGYEGEVGFERELGSSGFGSLIGGLNFRVSRLSAFGQYQITTGPSIRSVSALIGPSDNPQTLVSTGSLFTGPTHTFSAGLRFGLGNARERATGGGY